MTKEHPVLNEDDISRTLVRIAHEIVEKNSQRSPIIVGVHRRGAYLARRLKQLIPARVEDEVQ